MDRGTMVLVACTIEAGAFSGERVFRLALADGEGYSGLAPAHHCRDGEGRHLGRDDPPAGRSIAGYVEGLLIEGGGDRATVEFPNGEAHRVGASLVRLRRLRDRELPYVPLSEGGTGDPRDGLYNWARGGKARLGAPLEG